MTQLQQLTANATPVEKKTFQAGSRSTCSRPRSTMVVPVRRRLRTKTPPAPPQRAPSMGLVRRRMGSKGPPPQPASQPSSRRDSGGALVQDQDKEEVIHLPDEVYQDPVAVKVQEAHQVIEEMEVRGDSGGDDDETFMGTDEDPNMPDIPNRSRLRRRR